MTNELWITLADTEVLPATSPERKAVATVKGRDDLAEICAWVTRQVRQAYTYSNRDLGPDGTIPEGLKARAIAIATWRFVSEGVPQNEKLQTKARALAYREATDFLERISSAKIGKASAPSVGTRPHRFTRHSEDGL